MSIKNGVQKVGRSLSTMVMPNFGAFIAWGLITALFIPTGWTPNAKLSDMVGPMLSYLLPLLIGYTGGKMIHGVRGGVVGSIATIGVIMGASIPMFMGAIIVEPAKVLFLNNAINHGVFTPLGTQQSQEIGRSIYYMIESNPGPGLGLLLAYCLVGKGSAKSSAPGAVIIHFLGGIHEIYFPYVLMNPILILAMMGGGFTGVLVLSILGGGLIAPASPGSIFTELMMTPKGAFFANIAGILLAGAVSFVLSMLLLKTFGKDDGDLESAQAKTRSNKAESKGTSIEETTVAWGSGLSAKKIIFACDAGMGSSAMGATKLRKKMKEAGLDIEVAHSPVGEVPSDADVIVCHKDLMLRAKDACPGAKVVAITDFLNAPEYDQLIAELKK
jgi:PTS system mannitol-specific IIC component